MKRIVFLDYVRVFACFLVMVVHAVKTFMELRAPRIWWDRNLIWPMRLIGCG